MGHAFKPCMQGAFIVNLWYGKAKPIKHEILGIPDSADAKSGYLYTPTILIPK